MKELMIETYVEEILETRDKNLWKLIIYLVTKASFYEKK